VIFVTVGTHEQPFDRLLREVDRLVAAGELGQPVFCQRGYGEYAPATPGAPMLPFAEMEERIAAAVAVVAHGGPGTILPVLAAGKPLVLVPRQRRFGEHVDDHQVAFCRRIGRERGIPVVEAIEDLGSALAAARAAPQAGTVRSATAPAVARLGELIDALRVSG
jgi:UDP-N-acetylglucosamine transferase subunit ALG13